MTGCIILAAGASSRMGTPKQNLLYKGQTLLQTAISAVLTTPVNAVAVVLGANAATIRPTLQFPGVHIFINDLWNEGIASSIRSGLLEILKLHPDIANVLVVLADQPLIDSAFINSLLAKWEHGKIAASEYNSTLGPPVLFDKAFFPHLFELEGDEGAKKLIMNYPEAVIRVPFVNGAFDIDTPEDYRKLNG